MKRSCVLCFLLGLGAQVLPAQDARTPVLVELFTSEGCSDCPPADRLLEQLDRSQPVAGAEVIVLSEHVDYWDRLGWKDPFSAHLFSQRQENYARQFRRDGVYTPQMVVDGAVEFVGSDGRHAVSAIAAAARTKKDTIRIQRLDNSRIRVQAEPLLGASVVYLAVVEKTGDSQVLRGENQGRKLHHVDIVRRIEELGKWNGRTAFAKETTEIEAGNPQYRLVAFLQDSGNGPIRGAAVLDGSGGK